MGIGKRLLDVRCIQQDDVGQGQDFRKPTRERSFCETNAVPWQDEAEDLSAAVARRTRIAGPAGRNDRWRGVYVGLPTDGRATMKGMRKSGTAFEQGALILIK